MKFSTELVDFDLSKCPLHWVQVSPYSSLTIEPIHKPINCWTRFVCWLGMSDTSLFAVSKAFLDYAPDNLNQVNTVEKAQTLLSNVRWINQQIDKHNNQLHFLLRLFLHVPKITAHVEIDLQRRIQQLSTSEEAPLTNITDQLPLALLNAPIQLGLPNISGSQCWLNAALIFIATTNHMDHLLSIPRSIFDIIAHRKNYSAAERASLWNLINAIRSEVNFLRTQVPEPHTLNELKAHLFSLHTTTSTCINYYLLQHAHFDQGYQQDAAEFFTVLCDKIDQSIYLDLAPPEMEATYFKTSTSFTCLEDNENTTYDLFSLDPTTSSLFANFSIAPLVEGDQQNTAPINMTHLLHVKTAEIDAKPSAVNNHVLSLQERNTETAKCFLQTVYPLYIPDSLAVMINRVGNSQHKYNNALKLENGHFEITQYAPIYQKIHLEENGSHFEQQIFKEGQPAYRCIIELQGVIAHSGLGSDRGHYIAFAKGPDGIFRQYDNTSVSQVTSIEEIIQSASMVQGQVIQRIPL